MKIFITGGTGFIGTHLSNSLLSRGHRVTATGTRPTQTRIDHENFHYISADTTQTGPWQEEVKDADVLVNLAGRTIFKRWTESYKKVMYDSRILTTRNLVEAVPEGKAITLCSTSAVGYYGDRGDAILTENEPHGDDFLAKLSVDWEQEAFRAQGKGTRVIATRFGIVLGVNGGAMEKMISAFKFFVGGPLGDGMQWFSWIHLEDLISAMMFVIDNRDIGGAVNFCSPNPVRNKDFAETMGRILNRPSFMPAPAFMIRLVMGEFGSALLNSQRVVSEKLLQHGFEFQYPDIEDAIRNIVGGE
jgi:uncharacterized protein (TIGR01777 family)